MSKKAIEIYTRVLEGESMAAIAREHGVSASRIRQLRDEGKEREKYESLMAWALGMRETTRRRLYRLAKHCGEFDSKLAERIVADIDSHPSFRLLLSDNDIREIARWMDR